MSQSAVGFSSLEFQDLVRDALLHLYDAAHMQTHPLAQVLGAKQSSAGQRGKLLLQALLETVESLRPPHGTPSDSRVWRVYRLLELRYLDGLGAAEVMEQLAISKTQYHRDHSRALEAVASLLRERWELRKAGEQVEAQAETRALLAVDEADRLTNQLAPDYVDVAEVLRGLLTLVQPISQENHVAIALRAEPQLPPVYADRVALRQVFLALLNLALEHGAGGTVEIFLHKADQELNAILLVQSGTTRDVGSPSSERRSPELEVVQRLLGALGGKLEMGEPATSATWKAVVTLAAARLPVLLVLDNNLDFIGLVTRYLAEQRWQVVGARDVRQAESLALESRPNVILLDVMMPGQDGWDLLLSLKSRHETRDIPVVVCSVLYEPHVARALGAAGYLPKPVSQAALLEELARWSPGGHAPGPSD